MKNDHAQLTSLPPLIGGLVNFCAHLFGKPINLSLSFNNSNQSLPKFTKSLPECSLPRSLPFLVSLKGMNSERVKRIRRSFSQARLSLHFARFRSEEPAK